MSNNPKKHAHIMRGAPGSGKSTIAELERAGYDITIVTVHPPIEVCKARNAARERQVPEHVIDRMWQAIEASKDWTPSYTGGKVTLLKVGK